MSTPALFTKGAALWRKNPSTLIFEKVPYARTLAAPEINQDYADASNHDSPNNFKEWIDTFRDGGDLPMEFIWNPAEPSLLHVQLYNDALAQTILNWKVILNNATSTSFPFTARVAKFSLPLPHDQVMVMSGTLKVTANPSLVP